MNCFFNLGLKRKVKLIKKEKANFKQKLHVKF